MYGLVRTAGAAAVCRVCYCHAVCKLLLNYILLG
jgi:hypothetical protein